jgi:hypothetical protein
MRQLQLQVTVPWALVGDFNIYGFPYEKNNDNISWAEMDSFTDGLTT